MQRKDHDVLNKIDKEIKVCFEKLMILRSSVEVVNYDTLLSSLGNEEYWVMGKDVQIMQSICDIVIKEKYTFAIEEGINCIKMTANAYGECSGYNECVVVPVREVPGNRGNTITIKAAIYFFFDRKARICFNFESSFELMVILCQKFLPDGKDKQRVVQSLTQSHMETMQIKKQEAVKERERIEGERVELKALFKQKIATLAAFGIFTNSVKQLLDMGEFRGKLSTYEFMRLIEQALQESIYPTLTA
jgi:hypothetical protein